VPIGALASEEPIDESLAGRPGVKAPGGSWAASDFWGEGAAQVQDAVRAPVPTQGPEIPPAPQRERQRLRPARPRWPSWAHVPSAPRARSALAQRASVRLTARSGAALAAASLAVLAAFVTSAVLSGVSTARPARNAGAESHASAGKFIDSGNQVAHVLKMLTPAEIPPLVPARRHAGNRTKRHLPTGRSRDVYNPSSRGITRTPMQAPTYAVESAQPSFTRAVSHSSPAPSRPAGPSGPVSLIGAGTSPSG